MADGIFLQEKPLDQLLAEVAAEAEARRTVRESNPEWQQAAARNTLAQLRYIDRLEAEHNRTAEKLELVRYK